MPDFSFSRPTIRVRGLKALDYSLNRSSKDSEKSNVGLTSTWIFPLMSWNSLIHSSRREGKGSEGMRMGQPSGLVGLLFYPLYGVLSFSGMFA